MINTPSRIILIRHAESTKNLKDIHGGKGEDLTEKGISQCHQVAEFFKNNLDLSRLRIFASTSIHTRLTADIICKDLNLKLEKPFDFKPLYLGIADGLSREELNKIDPVSAALLDSWRRKEIEIKQLKVPNMEHYMDFWKRGESLIINLPRDYDSVMVCSNSLFILLANYLMGNHPETTDRYRHINIQNCGLFAVKTNDFKSFVIDKQLTNIEEYGVAPRLK